MKKSVSEVIVDTLLNAGAKRCYGIVGDTINHFTNVLSKSDLEWVHVRHEEVGAFAAGAEAYFTQELAVCAGTTGPGSLHFINGIFESHRNGSPVLMIASQIDRREEGLNFIQEVDQKKLYEQCSVFCERISHPEQARRIVVMAAQAALTRRGVAVIVVNGDMFQESTPDDLPWSIHRSHPIVHPAAKELNQLAQLIENAKNITLYAGIGGRYAHDSIVGLAEKLKAPLVHTSRAKEFIEPNNPYNVGMTGILGNRAGLEAMAECDLLICLGSDFAYTQFYPEKVKIVQIDIDPTHLGRRTPIHLGLQGDVGATIEALLPQVRERSNTAFFDKILEQWTSDQKEYVARAAEPDNTLIHPQYLTQTLDRIANKDAVFTADGGTPMVWLLRHITANGKRSFLTSLMHGTMANAYPQALGICKAYPGRQVIAMCGDGGLAMLMGDLLTLVQENIPVKLLIFNNGTLGFVEMEQRVEGLLDMFTHLKNPDFSVLAQSCGLYGARVEKADALDDAIHAWLAYDGPALLDVKVNNMELVMPPKVEANQVASTALFGLKAVLNGRASEVYSLLSKNFWR
ncbi:MAG: pyruvate dehydrogenase (quinone) [Arenicella sp.]|jgi:pyruvate dehydrogenase (quinone)